LNIRHSHFSWTIFGKIRLKFHSSETFLRHYWPFTEFFYVFASPISIQYFETLSQYFWIFWAKGPKTST
jgi:hypothetical protein